MKRKDWFRALLSSRRSSGTRQTLSSNTFSPDFSVAG